VKRPRDNGEERNLFVVWVEKNRKMRLDEEEGSGRRPDDEEDERITFKGKVLATSILSPKNDFS
jgi:lipopolysaccharide/colanic/teichoic acid biosynthesis glycosyltransferase